jgi:hypothetical protein
MLVVEYRGSSAPIILVQNVSFLSFEARNILSGQISEEKVLFCNKIFADFQLFLPVRSILFLLYY